MQTFNLIIVLEITKDECGVGSRSATQVGTYERHTTTNIHLTVFFCNPETASEA